MMNKKRPRTETKIEKVYIGLYDEFAKIASIRFINGLDKRPSPPRVQKKAMKSQHWKPLVEELKIAKFIDDEDEEVIK